MVGYLPGMYKALVLIPSTAPQKKKEKKRTLKKEVSHSSFAVVIITTIAVFSFASPSYLSSCHFNYVIISWSQDGYHTKRHDSLTELRRSRKIKS
jgi:hypothetical protein